MIPTDELMINYEDIPASWLYCFCDACPKHVDCLHYLAGLSLPDKVTAGEAVFPTAYRNGDCQHFKQIRVIRAASGFKILFRDVKRRDNSALRSKIMAYLGGHGTYYRYNRGERLLTPEQQQWILDLFHSYGYTENLEFDHYRNIVDFS